jgi:hypothetical protein
MSSDTDQPTSSSKSKSPGLVHRTIGRSAQLGLRYRSAPSSCMRGQKSSINLLYKNSAQVPDQFHRKLYRLSAKFEEADEQFEEIREGLKNYREEVRKEASTDSQTLIGHGLNLDTLQAFLDATFPHRLRSLKRTAQLLSDLNANKLNMSHLVGAAKACISFLEIVEKISIAENPQQKHSSVTEFYSQCGAMRKCLDIANQKFYDAREKVLSKNDSWVKSTAEGKRLLEAASPPKKRSTKSTKKKRELKAKQASYDGPMPPYIHKYPVNAPTIPGETPTPPPDSE